MNDNISRQRAYMYAMYHNPYANPLYARSPYMARMYPNHMVPARGTFHPGLHFVNSTGSGRIPSPYFNSGIENSHSVCRGYAKTGSCPNPATCIYAHPSPQIQNIEQQGFRVLSAEQQHWYFQHMSPAVQNVYVSYPNDQRSVAEEERTERLENNDQPLQSVSSVTEACGEVIASSNSPTLENQETAMQWEEDRGTDAKTGTVKVATEVDIPSSKAKNCVDGVKQDVQMPPGNHTAPKRYRTKKMWQKTGRKRGDGKKSAVSGPKPSRGKRSVAGGHKPAARRVRGGRSLRGRSRRPFRGGSSQLCDWRDDSVYG
eukprot:TRINITY_DN7785_c0_g1_i1.p1 TRINITY_DN7785_c0_g1~~TRINITY_DN7785_c0_g1_i1.p1  ORF type:complete len:343 (+),score=41.66 TRINITY_DN7785_c0_g1_i1:85-1029(+)